MNQQKHKTETKTTKTPKEPNRISKETSYGMNIKREGRKEKRKLMKIEEWLDDHATRRMETPR